jgi:hypothetical protein
MKMEMKTSDSKPAVSPEAPTKKKSRNSWLVVGVVAAVVAALVFAGGAFAVGRLSAPGRGGEGEGFSGQRPNFQIEPAQELPTTAPNVRGLVTKRASNTLSIGQRNGDFGSIGSNGGGNTTTVDVIVTSDTTIYHDITQTNFNGQPPSGAIQQKVEPSALDSISTNSRVTVWGDQNTNQITAKVLVYTDPFASRSAQ